MVSVDGTDCMIQQPSPFISKWWSHKFNRPGVRYEVGLGIQNVDIFWVNGTFPCGEWPDIKIFRNKMKISLGPGERVESDDVYRGEHNYIDLPYHSYGSKKWLRKKKRVRSRHESVNSRIKCFKILHSKFKYDLKKHEVVFKSIVVICQLNIENGYPLFKLEY